MDRPELPYLAAGAVAIVGGAVAEKRWPAYTARASIGTIILVIVASATSETAIGPLFHAFGLLVLLVAVMAAINLNLKKRKK